MRIKSTAFLIKDKQHAQEFIDVYNRMTSQKEYDYLATHCSFIDLCMLSSVPNMFMYVNSQPTQPSDTGNSVRVMHNESVRFLQIAKERELLNSDFVIVPAINKLKDITK